MSLGFTDPPTAAQTIETALMNTTTVPVPTSADLSQLLGLNTTTVEQALPQTSLSDATVQIPQQTTTVADVAHSEILNRLNAIEKKLEEGFAAVIATRNTGKLPVSLPLDKIFPAQGGRKRMPTRRVKKGRSRGRSKKYRKI
jgi:hypothetical protein